MPRVRRLLVPLTVAGASIVGGCGGSDDATPAPDPSTTGTRASTTAAGPTVVVATTTRTAPPSPTTTLLPIASTALVTVATPGPPTTAPPPAPSDVGTVAQTTGAPLPTGVAPDCTEAALDAVAAPAAAHLWDDLQCVEGFAHAYLVFDDPSASSPEYVFAADGATWRVLASGVDLDGADALTGVPAAVLTAFQLVGPGDLDSAAPAPDSAPTTPPDAPGPSPDAPACDAAALSLALTSVEAGTRLVNVVCAGEYARALADLGDGTAVDVVFAAGPSGWRELASGADLTASPDVAGLPAEVRERLGL